MAVGPVYSSKPIMLWQSVQLWRKYWRPVLLRFHLGGTMGAGETTPVVEFLNEKGLLNKFK